MQKHHYTDPLYQCTPLDSIFKQKFRPGKTSFYIKEKPSKIDFFIFKYFTRSAHTFQYLFLFWFITSHVINYVFLSFQQPIPSIFPLLNPVYVACSQRSISKLYVLLRV